MTIEAPDAGLAERAAALLAGLDRTHVGAAMSKLISASIGDMVVVLSRAPVGCVTWASVSDAVAARLAEGNGPAARLKPEEWTSGPNLWLIDAVGEPRVLAEALAMLVETRFKDQPVRMVVRDAGGEARVETVQHMLGDVLTAQVGT